MGTLFTISSVCYAVLAIVFVDLRIAFSFVTIILTGFFWIGYRVAKILHAIEFRIWIIKAFIEFMVAVVLITISLFFYVIIGLHENIAGLLGFGLYLIPYRLTRFHTHGNAIWKWLVNTDSQSNFEDSGIEGWLINNLVETTIIFHVVYSAIPLYILLSVFAIGDVTIESLFTTSLILLYGLILFVKLIPKLYQKKAEAIRTRIIPTEKRKSKKFFIIIVGVILVIINFLMSFIEPLPIIVECIRLGLGLTGFIIILSLIYEYEK